MMTSDAAQYKRELDRSISYAEANMELGEYKERRGGIMRRFFKRR